MEQRTRGHGLLPLSRLTPGQTGTVAVMNVEQGVKKRLLDLGLCPGTEICLRVRSPLADPAVYEFNGTWAALRRRDAAGILVIRTAAPEL